jgi:hypothetical protein
MAELGKLYKHKKSGHIVKVIHIGRLQTAFPTTHLDDMQIMVIYYHDFNVWVRSEAEFNDGRFELYNA